MEVSKGQVKALELLRQVGATGEALGLTDWGRLLWAVQAYREEDDLDSLAGTLMPYQDPLEPAGQAWRPGLIPSSAPCRLPLLARILRPCAAFPSGLRA
ncbi:hypothetical protein [Thermus albus]|uniref:hypothetical protein n=1 Tax=Thermus albus TaxID=2908146 RepID=UPI001FAA12FB|nr:hypothetical protein [Thermus albus]